MSLHSKQTNISKKKTVKRKRMPSPDSKKRLQKKPILHYSFLEFVEKISQKENLSPLHRRD